MRLVGCGMGRRARGRDDPQPSSGGGSSLLLDDFTHTPKFAGWTGGLLRTAYAGHIIRIRRGSDDAEINVDAVAGVTNTAAIAAHCAGTTGYLVTLYDQSGNAKDITQATKTKQPIVYASAALKTGATGYLAAVFDATDDKLARGDALGLTGDAALTLIGDLSGADFGDTLVAIGPLFDVTTNGINVGLNNTDAQPRYIEIDLGDGTDGMYVETAEDATWVQLSKAAGAGATSAWVLRQNGAALTPDVYGAGVLNLSNTNFQWGEDGGDGKRSSLFCWNAVLSAPEQAALDAWMSSHHA